MASTRVILDTDCGVFGDDGAALVMLLHSPREIQLDAITTVSGNVWSRESFGYVRAILAAARRRVPVYLGAEMPLVHAPEMVALEGKIAFTGAFATLRPASALQAGESAVEYLIDAIGRRPAATVLAIGPLTNLAMALRLRPDLEQKIARLVIMGGNVHVPGNASPAAEFNFWFDPEAAGIVLRSGIREKVLFGLDICNRARVTRSHFDQIVSKTPLTGMYRDDFGNRYPGFLKNPSATGFLWDELAAAWLIDPGFVTRSEDSWLDVETTFGPRYGAVVPLDRKRAPHATPLRVMLDLDFEKAWRLMRSLLTR
jgi:purine nucleosidase